MEQLMTKESQMKEEHKQMILMKNWPWARLWETPRHPLEQCEQRVSMILGDHSAIQGTAILLSSCSPARESLVSGATKSSIMSPSPKFTKFPLSLTC